MPLPSIAKTSEQIRAGALSPVDLVKDCLEKIEAHSELNAFITVLADQALAAAPVGLQIVGRPGDDAAVLALARRYQV